MTTRSLRAEGGRESSGRERVVERVAWKSLGFGWHSRVALVQVADAKLWSMLLVSGRSSQFVMLVIVVRCRIEP
jgi:hypothetical protein